MNAKVSNVEAGAVAAPLRPDEVEVLMWPEKRGGMKVGMERGVVVHHRESGLAVGCRSERSQHKNRDIALAQLNAMLAPPAAVPVEALEGLVEALRNEAATIAKPYGFVTEHIIGKAEGLESCAERIERLIKERSNG